MDPVTLLGGALLGTAGGYGGALFLNKVIDYMVPIKYNPQLLLSGKTQNRIKSLSEHLYNQGFGLFHDKSKPP